MRIYENPINYILRSLEAYAIQKGERTVIRNSIALNSSRIYLLIAVLRTGMENAVLFNSKQHINLLLLCCSYHACGKLEILKE